MQHKIIRILNGKVSIASNDGTFFNVHESELDFAPQTGDVVQCFKNGAQVIVVRIGSSTHTQQSQNVEGAKKREANTSTERENESNTNTDSTNKENVFDEYDNKEVADKKYLIILTVILAMVGVYWLASGGSYETMTDARDGKKYRIVTIGNQTWMAENLDYKTEYSWEAESGNHYGRYYPWRDALDACPTGWHLPSLDDFKNLINFVGAENQFKTSSKNGKNCYLPVLAAPTL